MPIRPPTVMDIREQIARMASSDQYTITEIAELFGVTRPTVYKYRDRFREGGRAMLIDRSRAPNSPVRITEEVRNRIVRERRRFGFGSKKIRRRLLDEDPWEDGQRARPSTPFSKVRIWSSLDGVVSTPARPSGCATKRLPQASCTRLILRVSFV